MPASTAKQLMGLRLKAVRMALGFNTRKRGKTQSAFYGQFDVERSRGNNWERGVAYINIDFLLLLDDEYKIDPGWIISGRRGGLPDDWADEIVNHFNGLKRAQK